MDGRVSDFDDILILFIKMKKKMYLITKTNTAGI